MCDEDTPCPADLRTELLSMRMSSMAWAVDLFRRDFHPGLTLELLETASAIERHLGGPVVFTLIVGPILDQFTGQPTGNTTKGSPMQLHDNEKVDFTVTESDIKGANVSDDPTTNLDDLTWSIDDTSVATLEVSPDTRTCTAVAGVPGSTVLTVSTGALSATVALDVIASDAVALTVTAGTPVLQ